MIDTQLLEMKINRMIAQEEAREMREKRRNIKRNLEKNRKEFDKTKTSNERKKYIQSRVKSMFY